MTEPRQTAALIMSLEGGAQDVAWRVPKEEINKHYVVEIMSFFTLCRKIKSKLTELYKKYPRLGGNENIWASIRKATWKVH